jgi:hypothetical protein
MRFIVRATRLPTEFVDRFDRATDPQLSVAATEGGTEAVSAQPVEAPPKRASSDGQESLFPATELHSGEASKDS